MGKASKYSRYNTGKVADFRHKDEAADSNDAAYRFAHEAAKIEADKVVPPIPCEHPGCSHGAERYPTFPPGGWKYTTCEACGRRVCSHHSNTHIGVECWLL